MKSDHQVIDRQRRHVRNTKLRNKIKMKKKKLNRQGKHKGSNAMNTHLNQEIMGYYSIFQKRFFVYTWAISER